VSDSALQSRRNRSGSAGEKVADSLHELCELTGVASVRRVASNLKVVGGGRGRFTAIAQKKSTVDCWGVMHEDGRAVAVEVKTVSPKKSAKGGFLPCSLSWSRVEQHQKDELNRVFSAGGVAVLLIIHGDLAVYAVPWGTGGLHPSIRGEVLEKHRVKPGEAYLARWSKRRGA
jgi:penicillin-binding protein-related factor A (putative recombinase)